MKREKGKMKSEKVWTSLLLTVSLLLSASVAQAETVSYWDPVNKVTNLVNATVITGNKTTLLTGWYVVKGAVSSGAIAVSGDVRLILADGCELTVTGGDNQAGIVVDKSDKLLMIYGQTAGTGTLTAQGGNSGAGIGGGLQHSGGTIRIFGGRVTAKGGANGAGIGGGNLGDGGTITISGGTVTATGGDHGAGIGGGNLGDGGTVTISGGTVVAKSGTSTGCDIGGGDGEYTGEFTFTGGSVHLANSGKCRDGYPKNAAGTQVYCVTNEFTGTFGKGTAVRIPSAPFAYGDTDIFTDDANQVYLWLPKAAGTYTIAYEKGDGIFQELTANKAEGQSRVNSFSSPKTDAVTYAKPDGTSAKADAIPVDANRTLLLDGYWYVVNNEVTMSHALEVVGSVNLILADSAKLTVKGPSSERHAGIEVADGNALTIWGQGEGTGELNATGGDLSAGIGGGNERHGGTITISGGTVMATGGENGAGIGGGYFGDGGTVTISGGAVTATGSGEYGAGIGGGDYGAGGTIKISGGTVTATGDKYGAGIGGGRRESAGTITISGGIVMATGGDYGAGIGGGYDGDGGTITISGGTVTATSEHYGAGIGGGDYGAGGTVTISGGTVVAKSSESTVCGIGSGYGDDDTGEFTVTGGSVQLANSEKCRDGYPKNDGGDTLRLVTVIVKTNAAEGVLSPVTVSDAARLDPKYGLGDYNTRGVQLIGGKLYFYLEMGRAYVFKVNDGERDYFVIVPASDGPYETTATYLYATVTVGEHAHLAVAWTSGDGTVTNAVDGTVFEVLKVTMDVKVIFTPERGYLFAADGETGVRALASPLLADCTVTPPTIEGLPGTPENPWVVGEKVTAYGFGGGTLVITGEGAMQDFADAADVPWNEFADEITAVQVGGDVILGKNALAVLSDNVRVSADATIASTRNALGTTAQSSAPTGGDFEAVEIVDGKAYLGVAVLTNSEVKVRGEGEGWGVATNGVIEVPAPGKSGFFILKRGARR